MADINFNFNSEDLDKIVKQMKELADSLKKLAKQDIISKDETVKAKAIANEIKRLDVEKKKIELSNKRIVDQQERINTKQRESKGIIGGLEAETRKWKSELKSATTIAEKRKAADQLARVNKELQKAKGTTATWSKALGSFQFKFNALGNIAANVLQTMTTKMKEFVNDSLKMSAQFEGVSNAFKKIGDARYLDKLRVATRGAVNDLDLMKAAVMANNFKIPLEQLQVFLKFAGDRALQTGEDFNFLVDSIVKGLGRKSVLILDNLGLSVAEINEEVKKTGDFMEGAANVIDREMRKSGETANTTMTEMARLQVAVDNLKISFGQLAIETGIVTGTLNFLSDAAKQAANIDLFFKRTAKMNAEELARSYDLLMSLNNKWGERAKEVLSEYEQGTIEAVILNKNAIISSLKEVGFSSKQSIALFEELLKRQNERVAASMRGLLSEKTALTEVEQKYKDVSKILEEIKNDILKDEDTEESWIYKLLDPDSISKTGDAGFKTLMEKLEANRQLELEKMKQSEQDLLDSENKKQAIISESYSLASNFSNNLAELVEANKQKELSAVGDNAEKRLQIEKEYAEKQQKIAISQALINAAQGALKTYNEFGFPLAIPFMVAGAAMAGIEIGTIKKQKFAKGGWVGGRPHSQGGTPIEAEKGEYVINKSAASKHKYLLEGINENDQLKIQMALDMDRKLPMPKKDPYVQKIYQLLEQQETGYETPSYYVKKKGNMTIKYRKN